MFEKSKPSATANARRIPARELPDCDSLRESSGEAGCSGDGGSLRAIEWGELTARLGAARDFRLLLRNEIEARANGDDASFAEAVARYFRAREEDQPNVNPVDLEHRKGSSGMFLGSRRTQNVPTRSMEQAQSGDAREKQ